MKIFDKTGHGFGFVSFSKKESEVAHDMDEMRRKRKEAVRIILELIVDAFFHAKVPDQHFPNLEVLKHQIMPQVLQAAHAMFPVSGSSN